jgi:hypothetical protein
MSNGKFVTGKIKASHGKDHHRGFNDAMEHALGQLSGEVGTGSYEVDVVYAAHVDVSNPGTVGFYSVTLTQKQT